MKKYSVSENKKIISQIATENGEDPCLMLAIANVESRFNNLAKSSSGTYIGLFQLGDGSGGVRGDDRYDPYKNSRGAAKMIKANREYLKKRFGSVEDWMLYLTHQQGAAGFAHSFENQDVEFSQAKYYSNMKGNTPSECRGNIDTTGDFIDCWKNKVQKLQSNCRYENGYITYQPFSTMELLQFIISATAGFSLYKFFMK